MKKVIAVLVVSILCLSVFTSCGSGASTEQSAAPDGSTAPSAQTAAEPDGSSGEKVLGVICIDLNLPFYVEMMEAGTEAAEDYGVTSIWKSAESSIDTEIALIDSFIEQKVDCILVDPIDIVALIPAVERAYDAGIPVVTMGNIVDGPHNVNTIYPDYDNTFATATLLCNMIGGEGEVAYMVGVPGNYVSDQRQQGYEDATKAFPNVNYQILVSNYDTPTGLQKAQEVMASTPNLKAFACVTDNVTMGAMQALGDDVLVFSYDGDPKAIEYVKEGKFQCTMLTGSKRVGYWNIVVGALLAKGEQIEKNVYLPTYWIVSEQAMEVIEANNIGSDRNIISAEEGLNVWNGYREEFAPDAPRTW